MTANRTGSRRLPDRTPHTIVLALHLPVIPNVKGSWHHIVSAAERYVCVTARMFHPRREVSSDFIIDLGVGEAGSETFLLADTPLSEIYEPIPMRRPIEPGERVTMRGFGRRVPPLAITLDIYLWPAA